MADLSTLNFSEQAEQGASMALRHPVDNTVLLTDDGKEMFISLVGMDSPTFAKAENALTNQRLAKAQRTRKFVATAEESRADEVELLARVTTGWLIQLNGKILEFNLANARQVYSDFNWIRQQVQAFLDDRSNFLKK